MLPYEAMTTPTKKLFNEKLTWFDEDLIQQVVGTYSVLSTGSTVVNKTGLAPKMVAMGAGMGISGRWCTNGL